MLFDARYSAWGLLADAALQVLVSCPHWATTRSIHSSTLRITKSESTDTVADPDQISRDAGGDGLRSARALSGEGVRIADRPTPCARTAHIRLSSECSSSEHCASLEMAAMAGRTMRRFARRWLGDLSLPVSRGLMAACERFCTGETSGVRSALGDSERSSRMIRKSDRRGAGGGERESRDAWSSSTRWPEHAREGGLVVRGAVAEHRLFIARRWFSESRDLR